MTTEVLQLQLSPLGVYHLHSYLSSLRVGQVKNTEHLAAIAETIEALETLITAARNAQRHQELTEAKTRELTEQ